MTLPEASVVIATRDRAALLRSCLQRLERQTARNRFEVIAVDNGSRDDTPAVIAAAAPLARGVRVDEPNRAKARNAGIAAARGSIILFCDDDTLAPDGFVEAHLSAHASQPARVVTGPIVNVPDAGALPAAGPRHYSRAFFCTCNASVPKAALDAVGGFDERYDLYGWEDTDLGVRLRDHGLRRIFAWDAYIYHLKPADCMTLQQKLALAKEKGQMAARFVRKSPSWPVKFATGAYTANFIRAAVVHARLLRRLYERLARATATDGRSVMRALATEALVDAAYVDALRAALRCEP